MEKTPAFQFSPSQEALDRLSPEDLDNLREAMADFHRDILQADPSKSRVEPMPPGKADFPPLLSHQQSGEGDRSASAPLR